jgi:phenylacetate-coenzyme A ligase PaaK-like adenylate-forming protein
MVIGKVFENANIFLKLKGRMKIFPFQHHHISLTQLVKLKKLVTHAYKNFSFYKRLMDDADFTPHSFNTLEDLRKLPVRASNIR